MMKITKILLLLLALLLPAAGFAQKKERQYIRSGNRAARDSMFVKAETDYRRAIDVNPASAIARYNLGNTLASQNKAKEAMDEYTTAARTEKDKGRLAQIYHNIGGMYANGKDYEKAIEAYKESLRNDPTDDLTRQNLALAQWLLKNQKQNEDQNKDQQQNEDKKEQEQQQEQQQQEQQQQQQPQENQMSKENAEQMLQSVMQDEKQVQDKVKKQQQQQGVKLEKDW
jgi:tetratricopeptide (TPR) repeat protein